MSRAFVTEGIPGDDLPDRPVSEHPNYVTKRGLGLIEAALEIARREYAKAQASGDREQLSRTGRELRYWSARRASAQIVPARADIDTVQFGDLVTIRRQDGREQRFRIVGEDEAEPANGSISYVSPLAQALIGKGAGDELRAGGGRAEITAIAPPDA
jgi:transcription elongation GreA/GreB family factor